MNSVPLKFTLQTDRQYGYETEVVEATGSYIAKLGLLGREGYEVKTSFVIPFTYGGDCEGRAYVVMQKPFLMDAKDKSDADT